MSTLIITDSWDVTTDLVLDCFNYPAFRLNTDIIRQYRLDWTKAGFSVSDPSGRTLNSSEVRNVLWRKPFTADGYNHYDHDDAFFYSECRYVVREMYNFCRANGANALVEEGAERRLGKMRQLAVASRHFDVPDWRIVLGIDLVAPEDAIVKSMSGDQVDRGSVLYTTRVDGQTLDKGHVWFTQRAIHKDADLTIVYVDGECFGFECKAFSTVVDWRVRIPEMKPSDWRLTELPKELVDSVRGFMDECCLRYGRLDFVTNGIRSYFLEVNPNGQWAWLDLSGEHGLVSAMAAAIEGRRCSHS